MNPSAGLLVKRRTIERRRNQGFNRRAIARELGLPLAAVHLALARTRGAREKWTLELRVSGYSQADVNAFMR
jgi:DNA-directed RNA polymerase specialized sigma24 family protein